MTGTTIQQPIRDLLTGPLATCRPLATLRGVSTVLADNLVGALVVGYPEEVLGIVSERDVVRGVADGMDVDDDRVRDVMSEPVETIDVDAPVQEAATKMLRDEIRHLVVTERGLAVGIVSMRDVLAAVLEERPTPAA